MIIWTDITNKCKWQIEYPILNPKIVRKNYLKHTIKNVLSEILNWKWYILMNSTLIFPTFEIFFRLDNLPLSENVASVIKNYMISLSKVILSFFLKTETKYDSNYWVENPFEYQVAFNSSHSTNNKKGQLIELSSSTS